MSQIRYFVVLKAVETAGIRNLRDEDLFAWIRKYEQKHLPLHGNNVSNRFPLFDERRRDEASHFILRLAFCGAVPNEALEGGENAQLNSAEDARRWFVTQETSLLRIRLLMSLENRQEREEFLTHCLQTLTDSRDASIRPLAPETRTRCLEELKALHGGDAAHEDFIDCAWELVPDLVARRAVLLHRGRAFVPRSDCTSIILNSFKDSLEQSLQAIAREVPFLRDDRLVPLLDALRRCDYSLDAAMAAGGSNPLSSITQQLAAADIDKTAVHFPLCMQNLHRNLRADRHLKFAGRQQYGLFLKSIGLPLSEALVFWRTAFLPKYSADQFNKDYAYNVRHNYGQEGKRANYASYSCAKICSGSSGTNGEFHGCPFKNAQSLPNTLALYTGPNGIKLTAPQIKEVAAMAIEGSHYQLACTRVFEMTRPPSNKTSNSPAETITYPHKYYEASIQSTCKK
jgi:DNA primase large subunit